MVDVVLATGRNMPHGPAAEDPVLVEALAARGVSAAIEPWGSEASMDASLVVVRTTWDYTDHVPEFLAWVEETRRRTTIANRAEIISWNIHKSYLLDLAYAAVPVIPTTLITCESPDEDVATALGEYVGDVVIKPAVSVGAIGTTRAGAMTPEAANHLRALVAVGDALVQPFEPTIADGETSLIYFGGEFSHAMRKTPAEGDFRVQVFHGGVNTMHDPTDEELEVGALAIGAIDAELAYARVDLVTSDRGPVLMELELIEPQLFLDEPNDSASRFADVLVRWLN